MTFRILIYGAIMLSSNLLIGSELEEYTNTNTEELIMASQPTVYRSRMNDSVHAENTIHVYDKSYIRNIYAHNAVIHDSRVDAMRVACAYARNAEINSIVINQPTQSAPEIAVNSHNSCINRIYVANVNRADQCLFLRDIPTSTFVRFAAPGGHVRTNTPSHIIVENGYVLPLVPTYLDSLHIQEQIDTDLQNKNDAMDIQEPDGQPIPAYIHETPQKRKRSTQYRPRKISCLCLRSDDMDRE